MWVGEVEAQAKVGYELAATGRCAILTSIFNYSELP